LILCGGFFEPACVRRGFPWKTIPGPSNLENLLSFGSAGLSRKEIMAEIDASLRRLGTDYVDLYQIHRWDYDTPIEETLEALHDIVKAGKARYIGASSMHARQFARALGIAERHGWTRFVSMQNLVNLCRPRRSG
jgi:aryl-alcohol dehydrogenase-like predicted oxidoreductase